MIRLFPLAASIGLLTACTAQQVQTANQKVVVTGQLFCAEQTATGPLIVALADASGVPVVVTNMAAAWVTAACAAIDAVPVTPPANPAQAPVVAAAVPPPVPATPNPTTTKS
jgi:hypothetical protein